METQERFRFKAFSTNPHIEQFPTKVSDHEAHDPRTIQFRREILAMDEHGLISFINDDLLLRENEHYTKGNSLEHKILFLISPDVATAQTYEGQDLYTDEKGHPKFSEIDEFRSAVSDYFERDHNIDHVLSEAADIFYNLVHLSKLHQDFEDRERFSYEAWIEAQNVRPKPSRVDMVSRYMGYFDSFATALGFTRVEALKLAAIKYHHRVIVRNFAKDALEEERIMGALIRPIVDDPHVHIPLDEELSAGFRNATDLRDILRSVIRGVRDKKKNRDKGYPFEYQSG